jgi:hypothetical protein
MVRLRSWASRFFMGVRLFLPLVPTFTWIAFCQMFESTKDYWQNSQKIVDGIAEEYMSNAPPELTSDYDPGPYWICYAIASFLYLLGWLAMSWLTVEALRLLISAIF